MPIHRASSHQPNEHTQLLNVPDPEQGRRSSVAVADLERHPDHYPDRDGRAFFPHHELVKHRHRLSSAAFLPPPEHRQRPRQRRRPATQTDGEDGNGAAPGQVLGCGAAQGAEANADEDEDSDSKSRFMNITPFRFYLAFGTILLGYFIACFDTTLMASSHPVITAEFNAAESASWLTTTFMITNTGFQPLWGRLSDTVGRKSVLLLVQFIFAATTLWCAVSPTIGSFIAARAVCGLGAGGTMSMGLVILNDLVTVEYRGIYISHVNLAFGLGSASGAAFGGMLCDKLGWRWSFGLQVPVLIVCMISLAFTIPNALGPVLMSQPRDKEDDDDEFAGQSPAWVALKTFDSLGLLVLVCTVTLLILFLNLGGNIYSWQHPVVICCAVFFVIGSVILVFVERRARQPVMPLHLLISPPIANLTYANFLASIASNTILFNTPLWFQAVRLTSATTSGLNLAVPSIGTSLAGITTGYLITYTARLKPVLVFGSLLYLVGSVAVCFLSRDIGGIVSIALITGAPTAQGFIYPGSMMGAFSLSTPEEQAVTTTTVVLWRNLGIVLGVAISSLVFQNVLVWKLEEFVEGPEKEKVVDVVRKSVGAVKHLKGEVLEQVIEAYAAALKLTFITAVVASVLLVLVVVPCKLPKLRKGNAGTPAGE